ncbi:MAG: formylmethanofuran dehydrogenase subunit B, partial [Gammaproteobacteria bacterium]|nr:formylmethanofuran dehydrogenase subunit B [Gammaproteobacteria bacterium]
SDPEHDKDTKQLFSILDTILKSQYTTIIWSIGDFNQESAEHTVQALTESIKTLMNKVRCVALPLGGSKGEVTASQVATWQTGVPLPVSFTQDSPIHNPVLFDGANMLKNQEADCLLWIATYNSDDIPPKHNIPTIVFGHPNMKCETADVYLPVGVPGIDHRGLACRTDSVATLPLHKIRDSKLPAASDLLNKLIKLI